MTFIIKRPIRSVLLYYHYINFLKIQQRYAVTVTDEYRLSTKPRSSIKGVDLLRNPSLNKVNKRKKTKDLK